MGNGGMNYMDIRVGTDIGRYHILEQLGEGGMAIVYKAYDTHLENEVAIKVIRTENIPPKALNRTLKRFQIEAKKMSQLTHPNIVPVMDYGEYEGNPYLVMRYLSGGTLKQLLNKPIFWQEAIRLLKPIAEALSHAHSKGLVHRDIKPSNILIAESGDPILTDFGIAKILSNEETLDLTIAGMGVGTPEYMAPEQAEGKTVDGRADIYSLGVVFFELVTGRKPFNAETPLAVVLKQINDPLPNPSQYVDGLPQEVERVILKTLSKDPTDRYQSMVELTKAFENIITQALPIDLLMPQGRNAEGKEKKNERVIPTVVNDDEYKNDILEQRRGKKKNWWLVSGFVCLMLVTLFVLLIFNIVEFPGQVIQVQTATRRISNTPSVMHTSPYMVKSYLSNVNITFYDNFDSNSGWPLYDVGTVSSGSLEITGDGNWNGIEREEKFVEKSGFVLKFKYTKVNDFEIYFDNGVFETSPYRRFGVYIYNSKPSSNLWVGNELNSSGAFIGNLKMESNNWYNLMMVIGENGEFLTVLWDPNNSAKKLVYKYTGSNETWKDKTWKLHFGADIGTITIDDFEIITFEKIY